jgi:Zn-dependent protease with chaperone function
MSGASGNIDFELIFRYYRKNTFYDTPLMRILVWFIAVLILFSCSLPAAAVDRETDAARPLDEKPDSLETGERTEELSAQTSEYPMTSQRRELLLSYSKFKNIWRFASFGIDVLILLIIVYTGLSGRLQKWAAAVSRRKVLRYFFYVLLLLIVLHVIHLPADYYREFVVEHDYGFSNQTFSEWAVDGLKGLAVVVVIAFIGVGILYWLINRFRRWWLYATLVAIPLMVLLIVVFPVVVSPMFNKFEPLKDQNLAREMTALASKAGIEDPDIFEVNASRQSKKLNAYFTGMFGTRRIVLYDNIIRALSVEELKFVMAHEIGHYKMRHIWKGLIIAIIFVMAGTYLMSRLLPGVIVRNSRRFGFSRLGDVASLPLIMLFVVVFTFITQPIPNAVSRYFEYDADEYGFELSGVTLEDAARTYDKLSVYNLSDPNPPAIIEFWFYDHPALSKRVENIKKLHSPGG